MRPLLLGLVLLAACAPMAGAATRNQIIKDCSDDGRLQGSYTKSELRDARNNLPADVDEYTDCRDVLRRAELGEGDTSGGSGLGGTTSSGTGTGAPGELLTPATAEEQAALDEARSSAGDPVTVARDEVLPGASGFASYAARHDLPWQLIAVVALLVLTALAAAAPALRRRVRARRAAPA